ncbi:hypothetical protein EHM82_03535 [bacterium]|nr:MAG: hypothetical protein EHM82_03535 [bacterium]
MKRQALGWILAGGVLVSGSLTAEPLTDLRTRLAALQSDQPVRIQVDVELKHRGSAPLHLRKTRMRGRAIVDYGPKGVKKIDARWVETSTRFSAWRKNKVDNETPLLGDVEARDLADPAEMMDFLLDGATLLSDESGTWEGQPARLLVVRPHPSAAGRHEETAPTESGPPPIDLEAKIWLSESGEPLALERSMEFRLGSVLAVAEQQTLTFQQVEGRLLVAEAWESYSGTGLAVLHGRDDRKMTVTVVK